MCDLSLEVVGNLPQNSYKHSLDFKKLHCKEETFTKLTHTDNLLLLDSLLRSCLQTL